MKEKLTQTILNSLPNPSKRTFVRDSVIPGLTLRLSPSGGRVWYLDYRNDGNRRWWKIGDARYISLSQARNEARAFLGLLAQGEDPLSTPDPTMTLKELVDNYYAPWVVEHRKSGGETIKGLERYFSKFYEYAIDKITVKDIETWRTEQKQAGKKAATCNRASVYLKAMLNWAVRRDLIPNNPIAKLEPLKEVDSNRKVRYLTKGENDLLMAALIARENEIRKGLTCSYSSIPLDGEFADHLRPMVLLSLNTGIRWGSLVQLKWGDIDLTNRSMTLRADSAKSEKQIFLPLNKTATETFRLWKEELPLIADQDLIFPSPKSGGVLFNVNKAWYAVLKKAGITDFRWHDMRHTFASNLVMSGVDLNTVRELLGHADLKMTLRYALLAPKVKMSAVEMLDR